MTKGAQWALRGAVAALVLFLALYRLADYPTTWFDEGSHLRVPKALLTLGVYSDYSSDGLRHFGPTLGVGPAVLLPIAAVFKLMGVDLVHARLVIVLYLLGALWLFYRLARTLDTRWTAILAVLLLASSRSIALFETGRQVLGEVPAVCFLLGAFLVWFSAWDGHRGRLAVAGLLFGAAAITKYQFLLAIVPMLGGAFVLNAAYYRGAPARVFVLPGLLTGAVFGLWQAILVVYLGPEDSFENLRALRAATAGAATVFSLPLMKRSIQELVSFSAFSGALMVGLAYGVSIAAVKSRLGQQWSSLLLLAIANLTWYVFASVSWVRYAFPGLVIASLFLAKFIVDLIQQLRSDAPGTTFGALSGDHRRIRRGLAAVVVFGAVGLLVPSIVATVLPILRPPANAPSAMAEYLSREIPTNAIIETWEPEIGFLTDHNYHYPPTGTLNAAVRHMWSGGPSPQAFYRPLENAAPPYVLVGLFGRWVDIYPNDVLTRDYRRVVAIGAYELYARRADPPANGHATP